MKLASRVLASALVVFGMFACRSPEPTPPAAGVGTSAAEPDARTAPPSRSSSPASAKSSTGADAAAPISDPPPPGLYAVTISDRSNTCPPVDGGAGPSQPVSITVKPTSEGWTATLPVNTGVGSMEIDRSDLVLAVGTVAKSELQPDRTCAYRITRSVRLQEVTPTKIVVEVQSEYTEAVRCTLPRQPVSCARDAVVTYSLVKPFCASRCVAKTTLLRDGGVDATCTCPSAQ